MTTYYLATCQDCIPVLAQPFTDPGVRDRWAEAHISATGHKVGIRTETRGGGGESSGAFTASGGSGVVRLSDPAPSSVPVPVLEALASAWEDQAARATILADRAEAYSDCARMLREAITHGGQG